MPETVGRDAIDAVMAGLSPGQAVGDRPDLLEAARIAGLLRDGLGTAVPRVPFLERLAGRLAEPPAKVRRRRARAWVYLAASTVVAVTLAATGLHAQRAYARQLLGGAAQLLQGEVSYEVQADLVTGDGQHWHEQAWYAGPGRWRSDEVGGRGAGGQPIDRTLMADGGVLTDYDSGLDTVTLSPLGATEQAWLPLGPVPDLFGRDAHCYTPRVVGGSRLGGRPAVEVDSGPTACANTPEVRVWVDPLTGFPLKTETLTAAGQVQSVDTITELRLGVAIPAAVFTFQPPAGVVTNDLTGPQPKVAGPFPDAAALAGALPGGGVVHQGPFTFYATLYRDPDLKTQGAAGAWLATDVAGVGVRLEWIYNGPTRHGNWSEAWGPKGGVQGTGGTSVLTSGMRGGRDGGGLLLPAGAGSGDRVWFGDRISSGSATYGVRVEYTLIQGPKGLEVTDAAVVPWP